MISFALILIISLLLAIGLHSRFPKKSLIFSSKTGNIIYFSILYFIALGYCYLLSPIFLSKLSDQLVLETRKGEIVDVQDILDESSGNYYNKVIAKTIIVSEVRQEIQTSVFKDYNIGDSIDLIYKEEDGKLIEVSTGSKITSSLFLLSCIIIALIILSTIFYMLKLLSGEIIAQKAEKVVLTIFLPFLFLGIIAICCNYLFKVISGTASGENILVRSLLSIFFLILFSWVSWAYYTGFLKNRK